MAPIGFLHTSPVHVPVFEGLVHARSPGTIVRSVVDASLLDKARRRSHALDTAIATRIGELASAGCRTVVCTCSTIGATAEDVARRNPRLRAVDVVRVDRPMAERAVAVGGPIAVVAALESTVRPTGALLDEVAAAAGVEVTVAVAVAEGAWDRWEAGDHDGYVSRIARTVEEVVESCRPAVVVLAQASMAPAARVAHVGVPVLSSPGSAVDRVLGRG